MRRVWAVVLVAVAMAAVPARAAELTNVASAFDGGNRFDFRFRVGFDHREERAQIKREFEALAPTQDRIALLKDLVYAGHRDTLNLRTELGLYQDLMLTVGLPIVLDESVSYSFDQSAGSGCRFPPDAMPNCVDASNSSTVADGIVPARGYDAQHNGAALPGGGPLLFRGAHRGATGGSGLNGFDTFDFGLTWAPLNQRRDPTKPTWVISFEPHVSIGNIKAFYRARPNANHAVSEGVHRLYASTAVSRRWRWAEPYMGLWYMYPVARRDSLFKDYGPSQPLKDPMQQAGVQLGVELVPYTRPARGHKVWIDLRGRLDAHFSGRGYSQAWELLAAAPPLDCESAQALYNPACDASATRNLYQRTPYTGLTTIESYATLGLEAALGVQLGRYFRLRASFDYAHDSAHFITGAAIGVPGPSGKVASADEYNPAWRPVIDQVGRRYKVDNVNLYDFGLWGQLQF